MILQVKNTQDSISTKSNIYRKLCTCSVCNNLVCKSLFDYGMHVVRKHSNINFMNFTIHGLKKFIQIEILKQLKKIKYYNNLSQEKQIELFTLVKKKLKEETPIILKGFIPDGRRKSKSRRRSRSKSRRRSNRRS
jgi:hypothetical protein